jgi:hypothetical protein
MTINDITSQMAQTAGCSSVTRLSWQFGFENQSSVSGDFIIQFYHESTEWLVHEVPVLPTCDDKSHMCGKRLTKSTVPWRISVSNLIIMYSLALHDPFHVHLSKP